MYLSMTFTGGFTMPTYEVTIEVITTLNRKVSAHTPAEAAQQAEQMYQEHEQGLYVPGIGTERHQTIKWESDQEWAPVGT
jgi:hypothetical protein